MGSFLISLVFVLFLTSVAGLKTYECTDTTGSVIPIEILTPGHRIEIISPNYPDSFDLTRLDCKWSIKALNGAQVAVQLVDHDLDDGCSDNILNVVDNTPTSKRSHLKYPGKTAKCGQSDFGTLGQKWKAEGDTVTISFKSMKNNGHATFKLEVTSVVTVRLHNLRKPKRGFCPSPSPYGCPNGPCCSGTDCCVLQAGSEALEISIPEASKPGLDCQYTLVAKKGAQIAVNFLEMDIHADENQACLTDYVKLEETATSASSMIGKDGLTFCGQRLPNYPGPSVLVSGGNELAVKYHTDQSTAKKGKGFKARVTAINPICNKINFEYQYGQEVCNTTCGTPWEKPKNKREKVKPKPGTTTTTTPTTTVPVRTINETCEQYDVEYVGNDVQCLNSADTWEGCAKICNSRERCSHWTWVDSAGIGECCVKTSDAGKVKREGYISGSKACGACEEMNTDFTGNDIDAVLDVPSWEQCSHICKQRSDCSAWTWVGDDYTLDSDIIHKCHLKSGDSGRETVEGVISGSSDCGEWSPPVTTTPEPELTNKTCEIIGTKFVSKPDDQLTDIPFLTWEECANFCTEVDICSHWTFYDESKLGSGIGSWIGVGSGSVQTCTIFFSVDSTEKGQDGYVSGTKDCGKAVPVTTTTTLSTTPSKRIVPGETTTEPSRGFRTPTTVPGETTQPTSPGETTSGPTIPGETVSTLPGETTTEEIMTTEGKRCNILEMTIQVINEETGGPLPKASLKISSKKISRDDDTSTIKATHITDANGEVPEIGTLYGTYSFEVNMRNGSDVFRAEEDRTIDNGTCTNEACTECSLNFQILAKKEIEEETTIQPCTCEGQITLVNVNTQQPIAGACISFKVESGEEATGVNSGLASGFDSGLDSGYSSGLDSGLERVVQTYAPTDLVTDSSSESTEDEDRVIGSAISRSILIDPSNRVDTNCKDDWCKFEGTGSLFRYFETTTTWETAHDTCHTFGAHLASIPSMNVNKYVSSIVSVPDDGGYWIGGTKRGDQWVWGDDSPWNYANWAEGEPNNGNEKCVELKKDESFNDVNCNSLRRFVCKKKDVPEASSCELQTDFDGKLSIDTYAAGKYVLTVSHAEYDTKVFTTDLLLGVTDGNCDKCNTVIEWEMEKKFCNKTTDPISLKITVVNQETSDVIEGVQLTTYIEEGIDTISTTSNADGTSLVAINEDGEYVISAAIDNMEPASIMKNIFCDPKDCGNCKPVATLYMVPTSPDSTIPPTEESCTTKIENSLTVLPVDKSNDKPIPGAEITIRYKDKFIAKKIGLTNSTYKTNITENGLYVVNGTAVGYTPKEVRITTNCGSCQENDINLLGNDIKSLLNIATWAECAELCKEEEGCSHWTWVSQRYDNPLIFNKCHLKNSDSGRVMTPGLISGGENCDTTTCHNCINIVKLYLEPDVCTETDFTVSVFEDVTRTPIKGASVRIFDVSEDPPRIVSKHLVCPSTDHEPCGWKDISVEDCGKKGCCFKKAESSGSGLGSGYGGGYGSGIDTGLSSCFKKVESKPMTTDEYGMIIAPSPGDATLKIEVEKEGYEVMNGTADVFCQHPCDSCNPSFTAIVKEKLCEDSDTIDMLVTVADEEDTPIKEAIVTVKLTSSVAGPTSSNTSKSMLTDKSGQVDPPIVVSGTYIITATADGFTTKTEEVVVDGSKDCGQNIPVKINLKKLRDEDHCEESKIIISVFDEDTKLGLAGTKITLKSGDEVIAKDETDASGSSILSVNENGEYTVSVTKEGFTGTDGTTTIQYPESCFTELELGIKEEKCPNTIMPVVIINNATDVPIPNALVRVILTKSKAGPSLTTIEKPKYTDENGTAFFNTPMNGEYKVIVTVDGFDPIEITENIMCDTKNCAGCAPVVTVHPPPTYCPGKSLQLIIMDCKTNDRIADASIATTIDTARGLIDGGKLTTSETGEIRIPIAENGIYNTIITLDGYVTMKNSFEVSISMDDCDEFNPIDVVPLCKPEEPECTSVSLSWTNDNDIDLEGYRTNIQNTNDTCNTKPACCEGCKKELCEGVIESTDTDAGLSGTETITYCKTEEYSNMIYVSDPSEEGKNLPNSGAKIVITHGDKEEIIRIDETKRTANSKFWLAGCLTTDDDSFNFIALNKFTEDKPPLENPLYCYDRANIEKKTKEDTTLDNANIVVNIIDAETKAPVSGAIIQASTVKESISRVSKDSGSTSIKVTKNGEYDVEVSAKGYVNTKTSITLDCKPGLGSGFGSGYGGGSSNVIEECSKTVTFSLLPDGKTGKIEIVLNWGEKATDLDLHAMQINKEAPGAGCETFFNKLVGCENTELDGNSFNGGADGGEKITISNPAENLKYTYMIFVKDNSADNDQLEDSEAHIDISDGTKSLTRTLPNFDIVNPPSGSQFWFVGCLRTVGESFEFASVDTLNRESPYTKQKLFCDNLFKKDASAGQEKPTEFCEDVSMKLRLQTDQDTAFSSSLSGCGASCITVEIVAVTGPGPGTEKTIFKGSPAVDTVTVPISSNGRYIVSMGGDGYASAEETFAVNCDITECGACKPSFVLPVVPAIAGTDQVRIMLSWAYLPDILQLHSLERDASDSSGSGFSVGLSSGAIPTKDSTTSSITLSGVSTSMNGKVGMIFVENLSKYPKFSGKSDVGVTITDGTTTSKNKMDLTKYAGQNFWIAGCYKIENGALNFSPEASFLNSRPDEEVPDYCVKFYNA